jgi:hypothetical protein
MKCKYCTDETEWTWLQVGVPLRWKLCNEISGIPHQCKRNKPQEISADTRPTKKESAGNALDTNGHSKLWKKDWTPAMDKPSERFCGLCNTKCTLVTDCPYCEKFKMNPCRHYCPRCNKHPHIIFVNNVIN